MIHTDLNMYACRLIHSVCLLLGQLVIRRIYSRSHDRVTTNKTQQCCRQQTTLCHNKLRNNGLHYDMRRFFKINLQHVIFVTSRQKLNEWRERSKQALDRHSRPRLQHVYEMAIITEFMNERKLYVVCVGTTRDNEFYTQPRFFMTLSRTIYSQHSATRPVQLPASHRTPRTG